METVQDNGVVYVKATALAKKYRYTTDYIGQLCRAGKVEAKLIGRAWFVNEESLKGHKSDRYNTTRSSEMTIQKSIISDRDTHQVVVRREVRPVLSKATHRSFVQVAPAKTYNFETRGVERISTYHADFETLKPVVKRSKLIEPVEILEDKDNNKIKVFLDESATRKLSFDPLPEVSLRGNLKIHSLDDPDLFAEVEPVSVEEIQFMPKSVNDTAIIFTTAPQTSRILSMPAVVSGRGVVSETVSSITEPVQFAPTSVKSVRMKTVRPDSQSPSKRQAVKFVVVPILVTMAAVIFVLTLGMVSSAQTDGLQFEQSLTFSLASVSEALSKISQSY